MCNSCQDSDTLARVHNCLGSALAELTCSIKYQERKRKASNLKSTTQPRFYTTHKKQKFTEKTLGKPSHEEATLSQAALQCTETEIYGICYQEDDTDNSKLGVM